MCWCAPLRKNLSKTPSGLSRTTSTHDWGGEGPWAGRPHRWVLHTGLGREGGWGRCECECTPTRTYVHMQQADNSLNSPATLFAIPLSLFLPLFPSLPLPFSPSLTVAHSELILCSFTCGLFLPSLKFEFVSWLTTTFLIGMRERGNLREEGGREGEREEVREEESGREGGREREV